MKNFAIVLLLGLSFVSQVHGVSETKETISFTRSTDPEHVVLFVAVMTTHTNRSFMVFGDGRLVLAQFGSNKKNLREHTFNLSPNELDELLQLAADHRLPEYDATSIRAHQLRSQVESKEEGSFYQSTTLVNISLDSYTRGSTSSDATSVEIRVRNAKIAANAFPEILELQGVKALESRLYKYWRQAGWPLW